MTLESLQKRIYEIVNKKSIISLTQEDFDLFDELLYYKQFKFNKSDFFDLAIDKDILTKTNGVLIYIESNIEKTLFLTNEILVKINKLFNREVDIIYGSSINENKVEYNIIDLFLLK